MSLKDTWANYLSSLQGQTVRFTWTTGYGSTTGRVLTTGEDYFTIIADDREPMSVPFTSILQLREVHDA